MKFPFYLLFLFLSLQVVAQQEAAIHFQFTINEQPLALEQNYFLNSLEDSLQLETLQLYISDIQLFKDSTLVHTLVKKHHLIDVENPSTQNISILSSVETFNSIRFHIGVDSLTNMEGALGGDLDPMYGMYWTWQSGYINVKLEGISNACPARKNRFQYHLGGYAFPFNSLQQVALNFDSTNKVIITIALDQFFDQVDLTKEYKIMSPNQKTMSIAQLFATLFTIK